MAELNVEPKKSSPWLWIIIVVVVLLILFFLFRSCNNNKNDNLNDNHSDSVATAQTTPANAVAATTPENWEGIDYNSPRSNYEEITNKDIDVRNNDKYAIYSLGENILFDVDQSTIRAGADDNLKQIAESIRKRFDNKKVRIYGFADSTGAKDYNKELSEQRAESVKTWLTSNGNISGDNLSVEPMGEKQPVATNATAQGRQENRRVQIIVKLT